MAIIVAFASSSLYETIQPGTVLTLRVSNVGPKPTDLYGKFTWKIENFSEISKRELRSNVFEVGGYKWYAYWCLNFDIIDCLIFLARFALPATFGAHIMLYSLYLCVNLILGYHELYKTLCSQCVS